MVNLIKNELVKLLHKKTIYVVAIILILISILNIVMTKMFFSNEMNEEYLETDLKYYEEELSYIDRNNPENKEQIESLELEIECVKLKQKYGINSWQSYVIDRNGRSFIENKKSSEEYQTFIQRLDSDDWKGFVKDELSDIENQIILCKESKDTVQEEILNANKKALEWRLEKNICYGDSNKSNIIENWLSSKSILIEEEAEKNKVLSSEEKYEKQETIESVKLAEYTIENNIDDSVSGNYDGSKSIYTTNANSEFINAFSNYGLIIIILIVIIAGTIVSDEFNKGTIKLLLVRPYSRTKILVAKFVTGLIVLILSMLFITIVQFVEAGVINGFGDYMKDVFLYNHNIEAVERCNLLNQVFIAGISQLPIYILLMTLSFTISVVLLNSPLAIALPILGYMFSEVINQIAYQYEKARFLIYFVTPNWDLSIYSMGRKARIEEMSLGFSIAICLIYFIILTVVSIVVFKKRDIKNV